MSSKDGFLVQKQSQAEKDDCLIQCFHDSGFISEVIENDYSLVVGRKGTGKTALARFIESEHRNKDLLSSTRVSITSFSEERVNTSNPSVREKILVFILLQAAKDLYDKGFLISNSTGYWSEVFKETNITSATTYESFHTVSKHNDFGAGIPKIFGGTLQETRERTVVQISSESIFNSIIDSLDEIGGQTSFLYFVDDLSDYLDDSNKESLVQDIEIIKDVLLRLDTYNTHSKRHQRGLRFVACVRDDLFDHMRGSNINKLRTNTLYLSWNEESFAGLLIRRLPHFSGNLEQALRSPISSMKTLFPDNLFDAKLAEFDTKRYGTNFYAYMVAISFNRPRDFLAFCYAMRDRLSLKNPITVENIDAAETEYSDYFKNEIQDELYLASQLLDFDSDHAFLDKMVDVLAERSNFNASQLRTAFAPLLKEKTSLGRKRIEQFVYQLWLYGIIGYKEKQDKFIHFKYLSQGAGLLPEKLENYIYYLHRGLWWFAEKRKEKTRPKVKSYGDFGPDDNRA